MHVLLGLIWSEPPAACPTCLRVAESLAPSRLKFSTVHHDAPFPADTIIYKRHLAEEVYCDLQVVSVAEEVLAHLRSSAGPEALIAAFNTARGSVTAARSERRRQQALQASRKLFSC